MMYRWRRWRQTQTNSRKSGKNRFTRWPEPYAAVSRPPLLDVYRGESDKKTPPVPIITQWGINSLSREMPCKSSSHLGPRYDFGGSLSSLFSILPDLLSLFLRPMLGRPLLRGKIACCVDDAHMRECLRKIADQTLVLHVVFFRDQSYVVA